MKILNKTSRIILGGVMFFFIELNTENFDYSLFNSTFEPNFYP